MPTDAIHPGEHLAEELDALDMSAAELTRKAKPIAGIALRQVSSTH
jgi:hypothetical protein